MVRCSRWWQPAGRRRFVAGAIAIGNDYFLCRRFGADPEPLYFGGIPEHAGNTSYSGSQFNGQTIFDAHKPFTLKSVKVYTDTPGERTIELVNSAGVVLQALDVQIDSGTHVIPSSSRYRWPMPGTHNQYSEKHGRFGDNQPPPAPYEWPGQLSLCGDGRVRHQRIQPRNGCLLLFLQLGNKTPGF